MARGFNYAPGASPEVLEAQRPGLHRTHVMALGASRNTLVRTAIAARADCPLGLMVTLAHDYSAEVRCAVARNGSAQRTVMAYLAADRSQDVVLALLENPSLPGDILEELAFHKKSAIRSAAAARLDSGFVVPAEEAEDVHTPELAEHVQPMAMTADGMAPPVAPVAPVEPNVVDISTRAPVPSQFMPGGAMPTFAPLQPDPPAPPEPAPDRVSEPSEARVPQIFSPHSKPGAPAPTRTAPIRGFKVTD
jgi:hypothetical protein